MKLLLPWPPTRSSWSVPADTIAGSPSDTCLLGCGAAVLEDKVAAARKAAIGRLLLRFGQHARFHRRGEHRRWLAALSRPEPLKPVH